MHIMQLTDFYHPIIGGVQSYVTALSKELERIGHTIVVVTIQPGDLPGEETVDGVRVIRVRTWSQNLTRFYSDTAQPFHPPAPDPGAVAALHRIIRREQPDVIHSHSWLNNSYFPLYRAHKGPAHVVTLHDFGMACPRKTLMRSGQTEQCPGPRISRCLSCAPQQYGLVKGSVITLSMRASRPLNQRADLYLAVSAAAADGSQAALPTNAEIRPHPPMVPDGLLQTALETPRPEFLLARMAFAINFAGRPRGRTRAWTCCWPARRRNAGNKLTARLFSATPRPTCSRSTTPTSTAGPQRSGIRRRRRSSWIRASIAWSRDPRMP